MNLHQADRGRSYHQALKVVGFWYVGFSIIGVALASDTIDIRDKDWRVQGQESIKGRHIRLDGTLTLPQGSTLILEDCTLEILGDYSREHSVEWRGGTLVTRNCTIGGHVNESGVAIHTVFHLHEGLWEAVDTTVSYSYGISFHWEKGKGVLRGARLKAGPRPDAIILSGEGEVELTDSDFPIGLGLYCDQGGSTTLNLKPGRSVTATYSRDTLLPGVNWRLKLANTRVERWFLFLRRLGDWQPPTEITINESKDLIVSLLGHNLKGEIELSTTLAQPLKLGNLTLKTGGVPAGISMYAFYCSGDDTDLTITGQSHICELMQRGGKLKVIGASGERSISIGCTTLELSGQARMEVRNVHLGRPLTWQTEESIGEANVTGAAVFTGSEVSIRDVRLRTEGNGRVRIQGFERHGRLERSAEGGSIELHEQHDPKAKPLVWIYTDMSDKSLPGRNKEGTINDPDDISAMAGYLLLANLFDTRGIVVGSTHRPEHRDTPNQADWANRFFGEAYAKDVIGLNRELGGFPASLPFMESSIKRTVERFDPKRSYEILEGYPTVAALLEETADIDRVINVLCWGSLTEPAILVRHLLETGETSILKKLRFIAHWTDSPLHQGSKEHPENVANCREDAQACRFLKEVARQGRIEYFECGAIGQHGIVSGAPKGRTYYDQFTTSHLGRIFAEGKFAYNCVDHSDSATYWVLLGDWGVDLDAIAADGTNPVEVEERNERAFRESSSRIHEELLRRSRAAASSDSG